VSKALSSIPSTSKREKKWQAHYELPRKCKMNHKVLAHTCPVAKMERVASPELLRMSSALQLEGEMLGALLESGLGLTQLTHEKLG
jgi:hypothetical protein